MTTKEREVWSAEEFLQRWDEAIASVTKHGWLDDEIELCIGSQTLQIYREHPKVKRILGHFSETDPHEGFWHGMKISRVDAPRALHARVRMEVIEFRRKSVRNKRKRK